MFILFVCLGYNFFVLVQFLSLWNSVYYHFFFKKLSYVLKRLCIWFDIISPVFFVPRVYPWCKIILSFSFSTSVRLNKNSLLTRVTLANFRIWHWTSSFENCFLIFETDKENPYWLEQEKNETRTKLSHEGQFLPRTFSSFSFYM
mgnify:CR=1 FL=1